MLVKVMTSEDGKTVEFDSQKVSIAIMLDAATKEAIANMSSDQMMLLSAPMKAMQKDAAKVWAWAYSDWEGATLVTQSSPEIIAEK